MQINHNTIESIPLIEIELECLRQELNYCKMIEKKDTIENIKRQINNLKN